MIDKKTEAEVLEFAFEILKNNIENFVEKHTTANPKTYLFGKHSISFNEIETFKKELFTEAIQSKDLSFESYTNLLKTINQIFDRSLYFLIKKLILELESFNLSNVEYKNITINQGVEIDACSPVLSDKIAQIVEAYECRIMENEFSCFDSLGFVEFWVHKNPSKETVLADTLKKYKDKFTVEFKTADNNTNFQELMAFIREVSHFVK